MRSRRCWQTPTHIGVCFSYPAQNTPELDAKVLSMTKEVQLTGWDEHLVGADLAEELARRGCPKLPIAVVNDTPATYLSGVATISNNYANGFAGLVNGTGTNTCCLLPVRAIEKLGRRRRRRDARKSRVRLVHRAAAEPL